MKLSSNFGEQSQLATVLWTSISFIHRHNNLSDNVSVVKMFHIIIYIHTYSQPSTPSLPARHAIHIV